MYFWLLRKMKSQILAVLLTSIAYALLILLIMLFSDLPEDSFRYLEL